MLSRRLPDPFNKGDRQSEYSVVKSNRLVQLVLAHNPLTLLQEKILASVLSKIKPGQNTLSVTFNVNVFMMMVGFKYSDRKGLFSYIKNSILNMSKKNFWIPKGHGRSKLFQWFKHCDANKRTNTFKIVLNDLFKPYLLHQRGRYIQYKFEEIRAMKCRYSPRLYEFLKSKWPKQFGKTYLFYPVNEIKFYLNLMKRNKGNHAPKRRKGHYRHLWNRYIYSYPRFYSLKTRVLIPAENEINAYTSYDISIKKHKHDGIPGIIVMMRKKNSAERQSAEMRVFNKIHHTHLSINDIKNHTTKWLRFLLDKMHAQGQLHKYHGPIMTRRHIIRNNRKTKVHLQEIKIKHSHIYKICRKYHLHNILMRIQTYLYKGIDNPKHFIKIDGLYVDVSVLSDLFRKSVQKYKQD